MSINISLLSTLVTYLQPVMLLSVEKRETIWQNYEKETEQRERGKKTRKYLEQKSNGIKKGCLHYYYVTYACMHFHIFFSGAAFNEIWCVNRLFRVAFICFVFVQSNQFASMWIERKSVYLLIRNGTGFRVQNQLRKAWTVVATI